MTDVIEQRDLDVKWRILSLGVLNEGRDLEADYRAHIDETWGPARVVIAAAEECGEQYIKPLYDEIGARIHHEGRRDEALLAEALVACGLPEKLAAAAKVDVYDEAMRASTKAALDFVGNDVGVPTIAVDGVALFGPVVSPAPRGEDAVALWDAYAQIVKVPGFFELKRTRNVGPIFHTDG